MRKVDLVIMRLRFFYWLKDCLGSNSRMAKKKSKNRSFDEANKIRLGAQKRVLCGLFERLEDLNALLFTYVDTIKDMQPVGHGSLVPHLQVCKKEGCLSCLHVRWKLWYDPAKSQKKKHKVFGKSLGEKDVASAFRAKDIDNPLQRMPRGPEFELLRDTIKALESVRKMRAGWVKHISDATRATSRLVE